MFNRLLLDKLLLDGDVEDSMSNSIRAEERSTALTTEKSSDKSKYISCPVFSGQLGLRIFRTRWRLLQFDLFRIAAAALHIGNVSITATRADDALMPDMS